MIKAARFAALAVFGCAALLGACQQPATPATDAPAAGPPLPAPASVTETSLPAVDAPNAQQFVTDGGSLVRLEFDRVGSTTVEGQVTGHAAPVYAVPLAAGQTLVVAFKSESTNLHINVADAADHSGAALHRGEVDGDTATLKADRDMTFVIMPFQPRAMARRDETAPFTLTVTRN